MTAQPEPAPQLRVPLRVGDPAGCDHAEQLAEITDKLDQLLGVLDALMAAFGDRLPFRARVALANARRKDPAR
jgi:hypothetical protein